MKKDKLLKLYKFYIKYFFVLTGILVLCFIFKPLEMPRMASVMGIFMMLAGALGMKIDLTILEKEGR
jgi:hypothetical protein